MSDSLETEGTQMDGENNRRTCTLEKLQNEWEQQQQIFQSLKEENLSDTERCSSIQQKISSCSTEIARMETYVIITFFSKKFSSSMLHLCFNIFVFYAQICHKEHSNDKTSRRDKKSPNNC